MSAFRPTSVPSFDAAGVLFACWVAADGSFVWRSPCGRAEAGRTGRVYFARVDGHPVPYQHPTLRAAMEAAARVLAKSQKRGAA